MTERNADTCGNNRNVERAQQHSHKALVSDEWGEVLNVELDCVDENGNPYKFYRENMEYALFAICNASYYGGGFCPAPDSKLDDGLLDFTYVDPLSLAKAVPIVPRYSAGTAAEYAPDVVHTGYTVGGRFWSVDDRPLLGNCDGENFDYTEVRFKVEKHAMRICRIKE